MAGDRDIYARDLSAGWASAVEALLAPAPHSAIHFAVRIADPAAPEHPAIRAMADRLVAGAGRQRVDTIRNTIFPAAWARRFPTPSDLADYYRQQYSTIRRFPKNTRGTYFGRIVAYPMGHKGSEDAVDQLSDLVDKLKHETGSQPEANGPEISAHATRSTFGSQEIFRAEWASLVWRTSHFISLLGSCTCWASIGTSI